MQERIISYCPRKHTHKEFGITSRRRRYFCYYVIFPVYYFKTRQFISLTWRHACLFCFWDYYYIFFLVHQGVLNIPFTEIPHWWLQLPTQWTGCAVSCGPLLSATPADPWLVRSTSVSLFPLRLQNVVSTPVQDIAHARFPSENRCHAALGSHWKLVVSSGLRLIHLVAFWHPSHACCTLAAFWQSCL